MYKMLLTPGARDHQSMTIYVLSLGNAAAPCSEAEFTFTFRHVTCFTKCNLVSRDINCL